MPVKYKYDSTVVTYIFVKSKWKSQYDPDDIIRLWVNLFYAKLFGDMFECYFGIYFQNNPDSKVHGTNTGPTWVLPAPDGPHVGPMNLAIREPSHECINSLPFESIHYSINIHSLYHFSAFKQCRFFNFIIKEDKELPVHVLMLNHKYMYY